MAEYALSFNSKTYGKIIAVRLADTDWRISRNDSLVGYLKGEQPTTARLEQMISEKGTG